ncbi:MAG: hypothetical protein AB7H86_07140 [Blastocatellales bacterium]
MFKNLSQRLNLLYPDVTATVSLQGFMLSCFDGTKKFKVGIPRCLDHDLHIDIFKVPRSVPDKVSLEWRSVLSIPTSIDKATILTIEEEEPADGLTGSGVVSYKYFDKKFSRMKKKPSINQEKDFRWVLDLNGEEFHNRPLKLLTKRARRGQVKDFSKVIEFNTGTVYTQAISREILFRRDEEGRLKPLGRIAHRTGIDIRSRSLRIGYSKNGTVAAEHQKLEWDMDYFYYIHISNTCHIEHDPKEPEKTAGKTDFDLFYDLMSDPVVGHRKYDLQSCIDHRFEPDSRLDGFPDICILGFFGGEDYSWS